MNNRERTRPDPRVGRPMSSGYGMGRVLPDQRSSSKNQARSLRQATCRIDHSALVGAHSIEFCEPVGVLETRRISEVRDVLRGAEAEATAGRYAVGFLAYEAAPAFDPCLPTVAAEHSPAGQTGLPLAWFGIFTEAVGASPLPAPTTRAVTGPGWTCITDPPAHAAALAEIREAIAAGDTYLVNFTTRFLSQWDPDDAPLDLYAGLVAGCGPGFHAYFETDEWAVACASPELFFEYSAGGLVVRPIKGTAPRGRFPTEDTERSEALRTSPKERAENVMVVDMIRNDLGRVAVPGSVTVSDLWQTERHPTLWQLTSTVTAAVSDDVGVDDIFAALFPSASVTGAPKASAMSVVASLEGSPRGVYCGAAGLIEPTRSRELQGGRPSAAARFAVAIRTAVIDKVRGVAEYGSGGGITWDSEPGQEWEEVLLKAGALRGLPSGQLAPYQGLIETMGFYPGGCDPESLDPEERPGAVRHLAAHLDRITASAEYFGFALKADGIQELIEESVSGLREPARIRLVWKPGGEIAIETAPLVNDATEPILLCIDHEPVPSNDVFLFHKTTARRRYEERSRRHPQAQDVVLINERGHVTETTRANLAVFLDDRWCTPPLDCGLLPGIERARRLSTGELVERVVAVDDLLGAAAVATMSSLRGWRQARVQRNCSCGPTQTCPD